MRETDRPALDDEITPEMVSAGVIYLLNYDPDFANERDVVADVFRAMLGARPAPREAAG